MPRNYRFYERLAIAEAMAARRAVTEVARQRHEHLAQQYRQMLAGLQEMASLP